MTPAAFRFPALAAAALLAGGAACAADAIPGRAAPTRPANAPSLSTAPVQTPLKVTRFKGVEYVSAADAAARLGLKGAWTNLLHFDYVITGGTDKIEFTAGERETHANGLRIFLGNVTIKSGGQLYVSRTDFERSLLPIVRPALSGPLPARPRIIAIDAGHGGPDPGKENTKLGLKEKDLTLDVAFMLKAELETFGFKVVMTRTDDRQLGPDKDTDFRKRDEIANTAGADLFVSIHFNSAGPTVTGTEVFFFTPQGQRSSESWTSGTLDIEGKAYPANKNDGWSSLLAHSVLGQVTSGLKTPDRGQKTGHLGVLKGLNCPAILVESLFLSNDAEAARVAKPEGRQEIAHSIANGIQAYGAALDAARPR